MNITTSYTWYCFAVQYWKDGNTHVSSMDDVFSTLEGDHTDEAFKYLIDKRLASHPSCLVYEGVKIPRTEENEKYFQQIESCSENRFKTMGHKILSILEVFI